MGALSNHKLRRWGVCGMDGTHLLMAHWGDGIEDRGGREKH